MSGPWVFAFVVQWILIFALLVLVVGVLRQLALLDSHLSAATPSISAYKVGQQIEEFSLPDADGRIVHSASLFAQADGAVILLVSASCQACEMVLTQLSEVVSRSDLAFKRALIVVGEGGKGSVAAMLSKHPSLADQRIQVLADDDGLLLSRAGVTSIPTALVVDDRGQLVDQSLNPHVEQWLYEALGTPPPATSAQASFVPMIEKVPVRARSAN